MSGDPDRLDAWWRAAYVLVGGLFRLLSRVRYEGLARVPATGPAIIASNHVSVLDPIAIALGTTRRGRPIRFLAAAEVFPHPVWGRGLRVTRQIPVRRGLRDLSAIEQLTDVLRGGGLAGIFPEGRVGEGRTPLRGHSGVARVALATGAPVIPVGVWGTQSRWPRSGLRFTLPVRPRVAVVFGDALDVADEGATSPGGVRRATGEVMSRIEALAERARAIARAPLPAEAGERLVRRGRTGRGR